VIEADELGHRALKMTAHDVARRFPGVVINGRFNRAALARVAFQDRTELMALEAITHPTIERLLIERLREASCPVAVEVSAPSFVARLAATRLVVDSPQELRSDRALLRGLESDDLNRRLALQPDRLGWLSMADFVMDNSGSMATGEAMVRTFDSYWRARP
jgi:dephospho-CoA kinase